MDIDFPKQFSHLLDKYNISKEFNKNKSFLLGLDNIPELIYGKSKDYWFFADGKNGLYEVREYRRINTLSLNEIYHRLENIQYDFIIGYLKTEEKYLAKHPISGKMTEWTPEEAYEICNKLNKRIPELEPAIALSPKYSFLYSTDIINDRFPLGESTIAKNAIYAYSYALQILKAPFPLGESTIANDVEESYNYARYVIRGRFKLGEKKILNSYLWTHYAKRFNLKVTDEGYI
jgi:hypothetical protein